MVEIRRWTIILLGLIIYVFCLHGANTTAWADIKAISTTEAGISIAQPDDNPEAPLLEYPAESEIIASLLATNPLYEEGLLERYQRRILTLQKEAANGVADLSTITAQSVRWVSLNLDLAEYTVVLPVSQPDNLLAVVNKFRKLDSAYIPRNLTKVATSYATRTGFLLRGDAYGQFKKMHTDATRAGLKIRINSAYRSYSMQNGIYNDFALRLGLTKAMTRAALPGHSEHQTGLAVDLAGSHSSFVKSKEYKWLLANAHRYGFIRRYTADNAKITRYVDEPWHWRYVGVAAATAMKKRGIKSLEEYALQLVEEKHQLAVSQALASTATTSPALTEDNAGNPSENISNSSSGAAIEITSGPAVTIPADGH
jgi:LAS superfamily LD-carboxypeptidase LdcB